MLYCRNEYNDSLGGTVTEYQINWGVVLSNRNVNKDRLGGIVSVYQLKWDVVLLKCV